MDDALASYDSRLARDTNNRIASSERNQLERDARRADYDAAMNDMPITLALRMIRVPLARYANSGWPDRGPTPMRHVTPIRTGPNAWERATASPRGDVADVHKAVDKKCRHPLVVCNHKW